MLPTRTGVLFGALFDMVLMDSIRSINVIELSYPLHRTRIAEYDAIAPFHGNSLKLNLFQVYYVLCNSYKFNEPYCMSLFSCSEAVIANSIHDNRNPDLHEIVMCAPSTVHWFRTERFLSSEYRLSLYRWNCLINCPNSIHHEYNSDKLDSR